MALEKLFSPYFIRDTRKLPFSYTCFLTKASPRKMIKTTPRKLKGVLQMAYTLDEIEYFHDIGRMPDWIYYQLNGKNAQENYTLQKRKQQAEYRRRMKEEQQRKEEQKRLEAETEKQLEAFIEKTLDDLLKDFGK